MVIRQIIGNGEGVVIGCFRCGEIETLYGEATHRCNGGSYATAATISVRRIREISNDGKSVALPGPRS